VNVRGPLGAGKTTLSDRPAKALGGRHIAIDRILPENDLER
jgi:adenylate kinase family enzyme